MWTTNRFSTANESENRIGFVPYSYIYKTFNYITVYCINRVYIATMPVFTYTMCIVPMLNSLLSICMGIWGKTSGKTAASTTNNTDNVNISHFHVFTMKVYANCRSNLHMYVIGNGKKTHETNKNSQNCVGNGKNIFQLKLCACLVWCLSRNTVSHHWIIEIQI